MNESAMVGRQVAVACKAYWLAELGYPDKDDGLPMARCMPMAWALIP